MVGIFAKLHTVTNLFMRTFTKLILIIRPLILIVLLLALVVVYISSKNFRFSTYEENLNEAIQNVLIEKDSLVNMDSFSNYIYTHNKAHMFQKEVGIYSIREKKIVYPESKYFLFSEHEKVEKFNRENKKLSFENGDTQYLIVPVQINDKNYIAIARGTDENGRILLKRLLTVLIIAFVFFNIFIALMGYFVSKYMSKPIQELSEILANYDPIKQKSIPFPKSRNYEMDMLARHFMELLDRLEQANRFQRHFIQHLSHEIKTPLAILIGNIEKAKNAENKEEIQSLLQFQKNGLMDISNIMNALLDISKFETTGNYYDFEKTLLDVKIFDVFELIRHNYPEATLEINIEESIDEAEKLLVYTNRRLLHVAFTNLLKNGVIYSSNQKVKVVFNYINNLIVIRIMNEGTIIPEGDREQIFKQFYRGAQNPIAIKGFGLGLFITKRICDILKIQIQYYSEKGAWNVFELKFPSQEQLLKELGN